MFATSIVDVATFLTIAGYDQDGNVVGEEIIPFDNDRAKYIQLPDSFVNLYAVVLCPLDLLPMGYDNIELSINSPCFQDGILEGDDTLLYLKSSGGYFFDSFYG